QPSRPNRARSHQTHREAITEIRQVWTHCQRLRNLTVSEFRESLASGLQDLPVEAEEKKHILNCCAHVPEDWRFWEAIDNALAIVWPPSLHNDHVLEGKVWNGTYFHERFTQGESGVPAGWIQEAVIVVRTLHTTKLAAAWQIGERSMLLWQANQLMAAHGD